MSLKKSRETETPTTWPHGVDVNIVLGSLAIAAMLPFVTAVLVVTDAGVERVTRRLRGRP